MNAESSYTSFVKQSMLLQAVLKDRHLLGYAFAASHLEVSRFVALLPIFSLAEDFICFNINFLEVYEVAYN